MTALDAAADAELDAAADAAGRGGGTARHLNACHFLLPERGSVD